MDAYLKKQHHHFASVDLHLNGKRIDRVNEVGFLGVIITADLTWSAHIQTFRLLYRRQEGNWGILILLNPYKSLICPMLEYFCLVWDPSSKTLIQLFESTQKCAAKLCLGD